jgi:hypothetical protein
MPHVVVGEFLRLGLLSDTRRKYKLRMGHHIYLTMQVLADISVNSMSEGSRDPLHDISSLLNRYLSRVTLAFAYVRTQ